MSTPGGPLASFRPTFALLRALDASNLLADTPIYERMQMIRDGMVYDIGYGPQHPVDVLHALQQQASEIQQFQLSPVIAPGEESRYHIDLTMSYEQALQGVQRVTVLATAFLGHVKAIHSQLSHVAPTFGIWWQVGAQELLAHEGGTNKLFNDKNLNILAANAFSSMLGEADLEIAAIIDATTLLLADLKNRLKLADATYQLGKDQVNASLADTKIGNVGLLKGTPSTLRHASPQAGTVGTLERAFPGRVVEVAPQEDDGFQLGDDESSEEATAEILANPHLTQRLKASVAQAASGQTVSLEEAEERLGLTASEEPEAPAPVAPPEPEPEPAAKPKRASRKKEKPAAEAPAAIPPVEEVTRKVTTSDPFAEVRVTTPARVEQETDGIATVVTVTPTHGEAPKDSDPLGLDDGFTPVPAQPAPEPPPTENLEEDDFPLSETAPAAVAAPATPSAPAASFGDDDEDALFSSITTVQNQTPATKELQEQSDPAPAQVAAETPAATPAPASDARTTAKPYRPNSSSSTATEAPSKILPQIIDAPLQPIFRPRPGKGPVYHQNHPPFVLPNQTPAAAVAESAESVERII